MSLLLRTAQLRYGMPLHQGYEIKHIIMCFIKQEERCKRSGILKEQLVQGFYNMILYNKSLNNTFTKNNITIYNK
jgi:hypothetical protein